MEKHNFERYDLNEELINALRNDGIEHPTEIQERLIPSIKRGVDVIGKSQTGTGKTLAFLLPMLQNVNADVVETQYIVTAPTRELASQLYDVFTRYAGKSITTSLVVGGTDRNRMVEKVSNKPHVVIGTPGRVLDMMKEHAIHPGTVKGFVVDEADQMLDLGFLEEVNAIASALDEDTQLLVFSATIPESLMPFLKRYMKQPKQVEVQPKTISPKEMEHWLISDRDKERHEALLSVIRKVNPFLAIVFCNTKEMADAVYSTLQNEGLNVDLLHGGVAPRKRKKVLKKLQDADVQYLVATDLIARGIDITGVSHIINAEIPHELDYYIHRVGRTARAGWTGKALTIYGRSDEAAIAKLKKRGIHFVYKEWKNDEWATVEKRSDNRPQQQVTSMPAKKKNAKVKPAYKKKAREKAERDQKRERRLNRRRDNKK
ncbi:DEAD/DEAH box helicase [Alkalicoccus daliensis]|uniref:ATP-dependent RNA helicase CshB n=1 Tax=Alkalicoccus daliensis TaxID=745820 RepID=A0A1H0BB13_9BACI|nr:DEAD/DEAH box helicase [Alkalicoccus daliensis]SDN42835.1 ATP-dependent RNA helicase CshB [Alkalicoccus daliensis]